MKKTKLTRSLLAACSIVALTAVMYGCVHDGGSDDPEPVVEETPTPTPDPGPTDLENAQAAAKAAADEAKTASDSAAMAASDAGDATANLATAQTGAMAMSQADAAQEQADAAMAAYMAAKAASDAAAAATDATAAIRAQITAEAEQAKAEAAAMKASEYGDKAMASAMGELMIDGTMKSVGETTVDADAPNNVRTTGSGPTEQKVITGLITSVNTDGPQTLGRLTVAEDIQTDATEYKSPVADAAARPLGIGKTVDSADDMARLRIVTKYASTQTVRVFARTDAALADTFNSTTAGMITVDVGGTATPRPLTSLGMFYRAGGDDGSLATADPTGGPPADTPAGDVVSSTEEPVEVFSYTAGDGATAYAVVDSKTEQAGTTTYSYAAADIHVAANPTGRTADASTNTLVTAELPVPKSYSHVHFGVWASLGEAVKNGDQEIVDLGIGFVQSVGDGMTGADMPNAGEAKYNGNWVAAVRTAHPDGDGSLSLEDGAVVLTANFDKDEISADLKGLAELEGSIDGNTFSGTKATAESGNSHGLTAGGTFSGTFSGGFYGSEAAESAGIFNFDGKAAGAFRGAFGGAKEADD